MRYNYQLFVQFIFTVKSFGYGTRRLKIIVIEKWNLWSVQILDEVAGVTFRAYARGKYLNLSFLLHLCDDKSKLPFQSRYGNQSRR